MAETSVEIKTEQYFLLHNGKAVKSLSELVEVLKTIDDSIFSFHVNANKNDFGNWIKDVLKDFELASKIANIKTKEGLIKEIESKLLDTNKIEEVRADMKKAISEKLNLIKLIREAVKDELDKLSKGELSHGFDEILKKEREIEIREQKIEEIEKRIENSLTESNWKNFFAKEFLHGLAIGMLVTVIVAIVYIKFFL